MKYAHPMSLIGTENRACEVRFSSKTECGHVSLYPVYTLFITYFTTDFRFCELFFCHIKYFKCSTLFETLVISFGSESWEILLIQNNKQTLRENWHQKTTANAAHEWLFRSTCTTSSFIRTCICHDTMLLTLFSIWQSQKRFGSSCEKAHVDCNVMATSCFRR